MRRLPPNSSKRRQKQQAGIALIEVLVSVLLFSLGILGLIGLQSRAVSISVDAEDRNRAALLANEIASQMWINRTVALPAAMVTAWRDRVSAQTTTGLPNAVGDIVNVSPNSADVTIRWRSPTRTAEQQDSILTTRVTVNLP